MIQSHLYAHLYIQEQSRAYVPKSWQIYPTYAEKHLPNVSTVGAKRQFPQDEWHK